MTKSKIIIITLAFLLLCLSVFLITFSMQNSIKQADTTVADAILEAEKLSLGYFYDEALAVLDATEKLDDERIIAAKQNIESKKAEIVEYDGQFYHVFFHSLIVYPELAFDGDYMHEGYDMWMTTVSEFKAMLPQMYERGFILYSMKDIKKDEKIKLPKGKKPLIISIDDVNYYEYMEPDGFADRLVIGENGEVLTEVKTPTGEKIITNDGDVMPILDAFVKEHPDFSYRGAKGIVAVTGYEGALGYNFEDAPEEEKENLKAEAKKVAKALQDTGWLLACHSYTHNSYFMDSAVTNDQLHYDTNRFKERTADIVFNPDIYISPFGYHLAEGDERLQYLKDMGYNTFCPVSSAMRTFFTKEGVLIQERFNLDRYNMRNKKQFINETFFDVDSVYYK